MFYRFRRSLRKIRLRLNRELMLVHQFDNMIPVSHLDDLEIKQLSAEHVAMLQDVWPVDEKKMQKRLADHSRCYITQINGKCLSYHWVQTKDAHFIQQMGVSRHLPQGHAMIYHTRVAEEARGKGINAMVLARILQDLKDENFLCAWIYTNKHNHANLKGLKSIGFKLVKQLTSVEYYQDRFFGISKFHFNLK